jgi:ribosomal protein S18 acetylase RimI-like enzyme
MLLEQLNKIKNVELLSKIIFFHFLYLQYEKNIQFSTSNIENILTSSSMLGWFLLEDNKNISGYLIGEVRILEDGRRVFFISYFYIIEIQRRKGYGTKMMKNAMSYCINNNIQFIMLISKKNDIFFKKLGFSKDILIQLDNKNYEIITMMKSM